MVQAQFWSLFAFTSLLNPNPFLGPPCFTSVLSPGGPKWRSQPSGVPAQTNGLCSLPAVDQGPRKGRGRPSSQPSFPVPASPWAPHLEPGSLPHPPPRPEHAGADRAAPTSPTAIPAATAQNGGHSGAKEVPEHSGSAARPLPLCRAGWAGGKQRLLPVPLLAPPAGSPPAPSFRGRPRLAGSGWHEMEGAGPAAFLRGAAQLQHLAQRLHTPTQTSAGKERANTSWGGEKGNAEGPHPRVPGLELVHAGVYQELLSLLRSPDPLSPGATEKAADSCTARLLATGFLHGETNARENTDPYNIF